MRGHVHMRVQEGNALAKLLLETALVSVLLLPNNHIIILQLSAAWPRLLVRGAQQLKDKVKLLIFVAAGQDRFSKQQLGKNAAGRPEIDGRAVGRSPEEQLWRPVPQRDDAVRVHSLLLGLEWSG